MINYITQNEFIDTFKKIRPDNFSYEGLEVLFEHLEMLEDDLDKQIEFDVIAICCDYSEYENAQELLNDYSGYETIEEIEDNTLIFSFKKHGNNYNSYIIQAF